MSERMWISVDDRLPPVRTSIDAWCVSDQFPGQEGFLSHNVYLNAVDKDGAPDWRQFLLRDDGDRRSHDRVTHWMPKPGPPT